MAWDQSVFSSNVQSVGWSEEGMRVTWKNGRVSLYEGVTEELAHQVANAPSVGQTINWEIKDRYSHRYVG